MKVEVRKDYYEKDKIFFPSSELIIEPGVTCFVGPNGAGKSSLIRAVKDYCDKNKITNYTFDNYMDGGKDAMSYYGFVNDFEALSVCFSSSEGQRIIYNMSHQLKKIVPLIQRNDKVVVLFDAIDSGLDLANINDVRNVINAIISDYSNKEVYFIIAGNSYGMLKNYTCVDVKTFERKIFTNYDDYEKFIINYKL